MLKESSHPPFDALLTLSEHTSDDSDPSPTAAAHLDLSHKRKVCGTLRTTGAEEGKRRLTRH
jgi:hypothetical protein